MHTPVPWVIKRNGIKTPVNSEDGRHIAMINYNPITIPDDMHESNARLIAAAPEMLDMLIELQQCAQYWSEYDVPIGIVDRLNNVIEKAKGDSHGDAD